MVNNSNDVGDDIDTKLREWHVVRLNNSYSYYEKKSLLLQIFYLLALG